jgi:hypothetical protein
LHEAIPVARRGRRGIGRGRDREVTDAVTRGLLRTSRDWPRHHPTAKKRNELSPSHDA